jgi:hypothetical protein
MKHLSLFGIGLLIGVPAMLWQSTALKKEKQVTFQTTGDDPSKLTGLARVVALAEGFKSTLQPDQIALLQLDYTKASAVRWSNFPQTFSRPSRVGLSLGSLDNKQMTAFKDLMSSVLDAKTVNEGLNELEGVLAADDYFGKETGQSKTFGAGNFYIAFLGTPSVTGLWELQYGGHHFAFADTYNKGNLTGATPSFRGVEPMKPLTANDITYQPMGDEQNAFSGLIKGLSEQDRAEANLSSTFSDVLLGPGADGQFPKEKQGLKLNRLTAAQKQLIIKALNTYVGDLDSETAKRIIDKYVLELPDTYLAFSGTGAMDQASDYIRLDGPTLWLEYAVQPSRDFPGTTHPHSVWRDRRTDYGGN